jgi:hypothetical protein
VYRVDNGPRGRQDADWKSDWESSAGLSSSPRSAARERFGMESAM